ncbi:MFS transporter [Subtercola boreus]|uniref:Uncharacterized protein n=1 Tax=Subtercola boreus TaxID=120213 RepID=A0A3E0WDZ7_9MICO|nr:MFS transporter [Subtercola boreus]RFA22024.1 hypothetical protein B7R24_04870 [Subtercola boreus]RFA22204.1 hypothetical protein B7R23_04815 [Subtercola boreus]RFA28066.1 hypothetical protein B7R25_04940 [Subtercola boreus]
MFVRRAFFYWQVAAVVLLPLWVLIGWSVFGGQVWQFLLVMLACGVLALAMAAVGVLIWARKGVRATKTLSWLDVMMVALWHVSIIVLGFFTPAASLVAVAAVLLGLGAFWAAIYQLVRETRQRVQGVFDSFQYAAQMGASPQMAREPLAEGEYIVIETGRTAQK